MESPTLTSPPAPEAPGSGFGPPGDRPPNLHRPGLKPTPDPTRTGALWVGGAGVSLLLAAAAVLTAVRWDDIGQSAKLGGLALITLAMLWAGQRLRNVIPMTAQAVFHLGALLIPFDMAAVSTLAGHTWQQTLLIASLSSVVAWYGIERLVPSRVLLVSAHLGVVATSAGLAAVTSVQMPVLLALAAVGAMLTRRVEPAALWAVLAGILPIAALGPWPTRIAGAMGDLGFAGADPWQPLLAGSLAMMSLVGLSALVPRIELAWSAVLVGALTALIALNNFSDVQVNYLAIASLFVAVEIVAFLTKSNQLWAPIMDVTARVGEAVIGALTFVLVVYSLVPFASAFGASNTTVAVAAGLCALGWLTADLRRTDGSLDPLLSLLVGSDWGPTTIMAPVSIVGMTLAFDAPFTVCALVCIGLAYWMVATWRQGAVFGAHILGVVTLMFASQADVWIEAGLGALMGLVLVLSSRLRYKAKDSAAALFAAFGATFVWLVSTGSLVFSTSTRWPLAIVVVGAWITSMLIDQRRGTFRLDPSDWVGRASALAIVGFSVWTIEPVVGLILCAVVALLAGVDLLRLQLRGVSGDHAAAALLIFVTGAAIGLAGVPTTLLFDVATATGGVALACASIVAVGLGLAVPSRVGIGFGSAAAILGGTGLLMSSITQASFALAVMAVGAAAMLFGAAVRDLFFFGAGYVALAAGFALQLVVWNVEWVEPYLVLPAMGALAIGHRYHRTGGSSWLAFAPVVAVFSYASLAQRLADGPAWHSVIAGAVGVLAVLAGGYRRLAGPLVVGSVVLAIVAVHESLSSAGLVPTWGWLALGGTVLLAAGIALERSDTTPLERTHQLRQVIATQFT